MLWSKVYSSSQILILFKLIDKVLDNKTEVYKALFAELVNIISDEIKWSFDKLEIFLIFSIPISLKGLLIYSMLFSYEDLECLKKVITFI